MVLVKGKQSATTVGAAAGLGDRPIGDRNEGSGVVAITFDTPARRERSSSWDGDDAPRRRGRDEMGPGPALRVTRGTPKSASDRRTAGVEVERFAARTSG